MAGNRISHEGLSMPKFCSKSLYRHYQNGYHNKTH